MTFSEMLKQIRIQQNYTQEQFARELNVSFSTINRWENGRAMPTGLAQNSLYELCREKKVPVYDMIIEKIKTAANEANLEDGRIVLYHGSKSGIKGDIAPISREMCDFGKGFYMGTEPGQPLTLICDYNKSKFYIVSIDLTELGQLDVPADIEWAMLVAYHRGRMEKVNDTPFYNKYRDMTLQKDLVIGNIANDRMFFVIDNFFVGNVTDKALINSLSALQLGKQYVAVSQKGCDAVRVEAEVNLSHLERMFMRDVAEENRAKAAEDANKDAIVVEREARIQGDTNLESSIKVLDTNLKLVQQAYEAKDVVLSSGIEANTKKLDEVEALVNAKANALSTKETNSMITTLENDVLSTDVKISQSQGANILQVLSDGLHANVLVSYDAVTSKLTFDNGIVSESWTVASNSLVKNAYYTQDGRLVLEIENGNGSVEQLEVKIDRIEGGSKADSPITVNVETTDAGTRMITADIAVSNHEHNGLTINGGLFVSDHASDIYGSYKDQYSDLQTILTAIQEDMPPATLEDDVRDLMSDVRGIADDINDLKDDMRGWDDNIKDLNDEIARLNGIVADLQSQIDNLIDFGTCTVADTTPTPEVPENEVTEDENNSVE